MKTFFIIYISLSVLFVFGVLSVVAIIRSKRNSPMKRFVKKHIIDEDYHDPHLGI